MDLLWALWAACLEVSRLREVVLEPQEQALPEQEQEQQELERELRLTLSLLWEACLLVWVECQAWEWEAWTRQ